MSRHQKALDKLLAVPPPADFLWDELVTVLKYFGYEQLKNRRPVGPVGTYHSKKDVLICCHEPHPQPTVDRKSRSRHC